MAFCYYVQITLHLAAAMAHTYHLTVSVGPEPRSGSALSEAVSHLEARPGLEARFLGSSSPGCGWGLSSSHMDSPWGCLSALTKWLPRVSNLRVRRKLRACHDCAQSHSHSCPAGTERTWRGHQKAGPVGLDLLSWRLMATDRVETQALADSNPSC